MNKMTQKTNTLLIIFLAFGLSSCVSNKKFTAVQDELTLANKQLGKCGEELNDYMTRLSTCNMTLNHKDDKIKSLQEQLEDVKTQRDKQLTQVGDLAALSQSANDNIKETLSQLEQKDKYIHLLQAAKTKSDSLNLALTVNLKGVLSDGIEDEDVEVKVDKTVVMINLSDKMLYQSGSHKLTPRAYEVLEKIAKVIESRPGLEVMVEGYTDNDPIKNSCIDDNWDLSVKRATSVVRVLQKNFDVDPNRLIAAGRGEYSTMASNDTKEGKAKNRRTRIIIMPKLNQFYDLLNPNLAPE